MWIVECEQQAVQTEWLYFIISSQFQLYIFIICFRTNPVHTTTHTHKLSCTFIGIY